MSWNCVTILPDRIPGRGWLRSREIQVREDFPFEGQAVGISCAELPACVVAYAE